jgi:hypothetical protein
MTDGSYVPLRCGLRQRHPREWWWSVAANDDDYDLMTEFLETVHYTDEVRDWRELPELGEGDDDEDAPDEDESDD